METSMQGGGQAEAVPRRTVVSTPTVILTQDGTPCALRLQKYKLLIVNGSEQGRESVIDKQVFAIGAGKQCDLILQDPAISRKHCEIQILPEGFLIRDLQSTNGTILHGVRICEAYLDEGTEFQVGTTKLVFCPLQESVEYPLSRREAFGKLLGRSVTMRRVMHLAETFAPTEASILIEGETGTGKEVLARAIHDNSPRRTKPFVIVDCGSLAKGVVESELFGHVKGAYTGAATDRTGAFQEANGGTVFLDEIGELPLELQPKLLRVLENKEIRRLGSNEIKRIDVRILAATNKKLESEVNAGRFREDLFYRLSVVKMELPPLRKRKDDLELLTRRFLEDLGGEGAADQVANFSRAMELFTSYDWPGNVRELRNVIETAVHARQGAIDLGAFLYLSGMRDRVSTVSGGFASDRPFKDAKNDLIDRFEREYIRELLARNSGNISRAAREAQIERAYLQRLIKKHGLNA
jgi:transcriptional regulator with GAF, ATPase, and Fis domain